MVRLAHLPDRRVLAVGGADRVGFLNGLVSNDVAAAAPDVSVWAALLTPQGKYLADFFIVAEADRLLLECEAGQAEMVAARLSRYRLRADVTIETTTLAVAAAWEEPPDLPAAIIARDPRLQEAGWRVLAPVLPAANCGFEAWDRHRLVLGLPDGSRDLEAEKTVLLEAGFDELHGISWTKGCYMGQELTARTRYRGLIKRRLVPVHAQADLPPPGTPVMSRGAEVGALRSSCKADGLATLRLEAMGSTDLQVNGIALHVRPPAWMRLPAMA
jgi:folate-binding protein YgfZ